MITQIRNACICDGSGKDVYRGDILIKDGVIAEIGTIPAVPNAHEINGEGYIATPGFVDTHRHLELNALTNPRFGELELAQGITTGVGCNCGLAPFPCKDAIHRELYDFIAPCLGRYNGADINTVEAYLTKVNSTHPYMNVGVLAATGAIKTCVKGYSKTPYTHIEMQSAQRLLCQCLDEGALGISCGIMYTPECYSTKEEFVKLLSPAAKYGRILTAHIRGEGDGLVASVKEAIHIAKSAGLALNISHFKSVGKKNWQSEIYKAIEVIEHERAMGYAVTADFYPYIGGSTTLLSLLPPSFAEESTEKTLAKLSTAHGVDTLAKELCKSHIGWDNMVKDIGWERIVISGTSLAEHKKYQGKSITDICEEYGFQNPVAMIAQLLIAEMGQVTIIVMSMCEQDLETIVKLPFTALISDALYGAMESPHPRLNASFLKLLRKYVVQRGVLTLPEAIRKMTSMPASRFALENRGLLQKGMAADLNMFRIEDLRDNANFTAPALLASGINTTMVNGDIAMHNNQLQTRSGKAILAMHSEQ